MDRIKSRGRTHERVFYALCLLGVVLAAALAVVDILDEPPVEFGDEVDERDGLTSTVTVEVTNVSDEPQCPEVEIAARDTDAGDIQVVEATPVDDDRRLEPDETVTYTATFDEITAQDYEEELDEFAAYAKDLPDCPGSGA